MTPRSGGLVLYKSGPARVLDVGAKIEIELPGGKTQRVRPKDVTVLHPGPMDGAGGLAALGPLEGEVEEACELMGNEPAPLSEVADLVYGEFSPSTVWAAWLLVADGLYFDGSPESVRARPLDEVRREREERQRKAAEKAAWNGFLERVEAGRIEPVDRGRLADVEELALGARSSSRVLSALGREQNAEGAHALLLRLGVWSEADNPYPRRAGVALEAPSLAMGEIADEPRVDLTGLAAFAIDDEGNEDPDDAISLDGNRLWVHVADPAALIAPGSELDQEASARGGTLYLPELTAPMLPAQAAQRLGLGLAEESPALSIGLDLTANGEVEHTEIVLSRVRVQRLSYGEVDQRLHEPQFASLWRELEAFRSRREAAGAVMLEFPEVDVKVVAGEVVIRSQPRLRSRTLVSEAMLMAGTAVAHYATEHGIPFPYATQEVADEVERRPQGYAAMFAARRKLRPRRYQGAPSPHQGLGLQEYSQVTSPLRRYLDLVAHQQLRAHLRGEAMLDEQSMTQRIGAADAVSPSLRKTERWSRKHWTLVWLKRQRDWRGQGVVLEQRNRTAVVLVPELALETRLSLKGEVEPDQLLELECTGVDLPQLDAHFRLLK